MTSPRRRALHSILLLLVTALTLAGCGGSDDSGGGSEESSGGGGGGGEAESIFASTCGGCHTLDAAGTTGSVGPNLDDLAPSEETVAGMIANGGGGMPGGLLEGEELDLVAAYVADNAGS